MAKKWIAEQAGSIDALRFVDIKLLPPAPGEVAISVRAAGMNPADYKILSWGGSLPLPIGSEVAGVVSAVGPRTRIASGDVSIGDEVVAFRVRGGYATDLTVSAADVFAKPDSLAFPAAANLLLAGTTAAEMLHLTGVRQGDTVLIHGASGAVGLSAVQQARLIGARVIGTAGVSNGPLLESFGATPVQYGPGLEDRVRALAPDGVAAALDCVGTDEAVDVSLRLVSSPQRLVTTTAHARATREGFHAIGGTQRSVDYRNAVRAELIELAGAGRLVVPVARTFPLTDAIEALHLLASGHAGGKLALLSDGEA